MRIILRFAAVGVIFVAACIAWAILGASTTSRTSEMSSALEERVDELWGGPQTQAPPQLVFEWVTQREEIQQRTEGKRVVDVKTVVSVDHQKDVGLEATGIDVTLDSDLRRKGLVWYSLYAADFTADWTYVHEEPVAGTLAMTFAFPNPQGVYDDFTFAVNGTDYARKVTPQNGSFTVRVPVRPGETSIIHAHYTTRGMNEWRYALGNGVGLLRNFRLDMKTDFPDIDYPAQTLSPARRERTADGWSLGWKFEQVVTGHGIGMLTPTRIQPGELAAALSFSAPISLLFFFVVLFVLATLRKIDVHPMNYLMLAAAFFAFHLLFAYSADLLPVEAAFALASVVSVVLVVSYLRLVIGARFAFVEAAAAQLVYLVGFSLAHFWEGYTGLTVTVLAILTLFLVMQLTGRLRWSEVFALNAAQRGTS
jgi:hypothetical protein